jgi:flagellar assembly protein FliH
MSWRVVADRPERKKPAPAPPVFDHERELALRLDQARQEAFKEGLLAGRRDAEDQIRPALEGLARTMTELGGMRQAIREEALQDLVRLAISIAARVIHREVAVDPDALAGLVQAAFQKLQSREIHRARMHPGLEPLVAKCLEQCGSPKNIVLIADPTLAPGELFFETSQGALDASVDTQLREIERGLIDKLER